MVASVSPRSTQTTTPRIYARPAYPAACTVRAAAIPTTTMCTLFSTTSSSSRACSPSPLSKPPPSPGRVGKKHPARTLGWPSAGQGRIVLLSISPSQVRLAVEREDPYATNTRPTRRHDAVQGHRQGHQGDGSGRDAQRETVDGNGTIQRGAREGRRDARGRGASSDLPGGPREVLREQSNGNQWAVRRGEGPDRRLLAVEGEIEGGGDRVGEAMAKSHRGRGGEGDPAGIRDEGLWGRAHSQLRAQEQRLRAQTSAKK